MINTERVLLENKINHRQEYKTEFYKIKEEELQSEISMLQIQKVKCSARNQVLLRNIENAMNSNDESANKIAVLRCDLEGQK